MVYCSLMKNKYNLTNDFNPNVCNCKLASLFQLTIRLLKSSWGSRWFEKRLKHLCFPILLQNAVFSSHAIHLRYLF